MGRPEQLYKVLSVENWEASQGKKCLVLDSMDEAFIHFATEEQLPRIESKFWGDNSEYCVLKIDPKRLQGRLVFEANRPGGDKYYHLYDGCIPLDSVAESRLVSRSGVAQ